MKILTWLRDRRYRAHHRGTCIACGRILRDDAVGDACSPECEQHATDDWLTLQY